MSITTPALADQLAVIETVTAVGVGADGRDWAACRDALADRIALDHDTHAGNGGDTAADNVIDTWRRIWDGFAATFHAVTNHQIELRGDEATCRSYVHALHVAHDRRELITFSFYTDQLVRHPDRWRITARRYQEIHRQGDPTVFPHD